MTARTITNNGTGLLTLSAALTPEGLVALNVESTVDQKSSKDIASAWLAANMVRPI